VPLKGVDVIWAGVGTKCLECRRGLVATPGTQRFAFGG
jgi:hypothetical protein